MVRASGRKPRDVVGITPVLKSRFRPQEVALAPAPAPPPGPPPPPPYQPMNFHGGPIVRDAKLFTSFWGPFTPPEINQIRNYVAGLAAHVSGAGAPSGQVPVIWQYGCRSAELNPSFFLDRSLPPFCPLMAAGAQVSAISPRDGHIDLFVTDAAGVVWSTWWENDPGWQPLFTISPGIPIAPAAPVTALVPRDGHIDLFATDSAGQVWSTWWEAGSNWQPWFAISPGLALNPGAAVDGHQQHYSPFSIPLTDLYLDPRLDLR
jgi:hypothetical protein